MDNSTAVHPSLSGTYVGQQGSLRLELRLDIQEPGAQAIYQTLNLVSGDLFRAVGDGTWEYRSSFLVEHPYVKYGAEQVVILGTMMSYSGLTLSSSLVEPFSRQVLKVLIPLGIEPGSPVSATVQITHWGTYKTNFQCTKVSPFLRTIELEMDRIAGTELPHPFHTHSVAIRPPDLPALELDITTAYQRAGVDLRITSTDEVFAPTEARDDLKWDEEELHHAMEHHFSQWQDRPQWKLYLLIATHFRLFPQHLVTGIMYDNQARDPSDPYPRQGAAVFYSTMKMTEVWGDAPQAEFDRNYLRTCVHELGHALNLIHSFDKDQPDSLSWMNYPWRYPYGYHLPQGWNGTQNFWQRCRFEFDPEELRHLRHHALMEVIPGGAAFGALGHEIGVSPAASQEQLETAPMALYLRTRPERTLFQFAEPIRIELKLKNQTQTLLSVPNMLGAEFGLVEIYIRDPKQQIRRYRPLFRLCGEAQMVELPPGEKLYESVFVAYGSDGFYFQEPGEYWLWATYRVGEWQLRSNAIHIRVAFPQTSAEEQIALWTFGHEQGHVLYMQGAAHLKNGNEQLREVVERFPDTNLAQYIHLCFGHSQAKEFKDLVAGQIRPPRPETAVQELRRALTISPRTRQAALDNITYGRAVELLATLYEQMERPREARSLLSQTVEYFERMKVKQEVIDSLRSRARTVGRKRAK
ncbi:MAG: hypothetical protein ACUVWZ_00555 [Anaerolineae bacterium]